ncbi:hypothetical protein P879_10718 [Paragonimus westermani]|uniref:Dynein heavy chain tail domain-containing protein n=1 Tax=Paragonimus westermani TaxID=34504 RepID=A0A8T0DFB6_9TREM|nr:hypothetical protein P879_10718 [Paragonimus westermani]
MASELELDDKRAEFIANYVLKSNKLKGDKWMKLWNTDDAKQLIVDFFDKPEITELYILASAAGTLQAQYECPSGLKLKACFFMKKEKTSIKKDVVVNKLLVYGDLSHSPLEHFSAFVDEENFVGRFSSVDHRKFDKVSDSLSRSKSTTVGMHHNCSKISKSLVYSIESLVIAWSHQIHKALLKDSAQPLLDGLHPSPLVEMDFWKAKTVNLENIFDQLNSPKVRQMAQILENANSCYFIPFKEMFKSVVTALRESQDIHAHLSVLRPHIEDMEQAEFDQLPLHIEPVFSLICLIWASSTGYRQPGRILILLQELCNLVIDQCRNYLDPTEILKAEPEEAIIKVQETLRLLKTFKEAYEQHRTKLAGYFKEVNDYNGQQIEPVLWEFKTELAFNRFDAFAKRIDAIHVSYLASLVSG